MKFRMLIFSIVALLVPGFVFGSGLCEEDTTLVERTLVAPSAYTYTHNEDAACTFPWENDLFYEDYRNQYLYPAEVFPTEARTIQSLAARSYVYAGQSTCTYEDVDDDWNVLQLLGYDRTQGGYGNPLGSSFEDNRVNNSVAPMTILVDWKNPNNGDIPTDDAYPSPDNLLVITTAGFGAASEGLPPFNGNCPDAPCLTWTGDPDSDWDFLFDQGMAISDTGQAGLPMWDMPVGLGIQRAYGGASIDNPSGYLTSALGIDDVGFTWVFRGLAAPPPATLDSNIKEIVRLLLTPEALRCSDVDTEVDGYVHDDPIMFPGGKDIDPVSPQVTSGAPLHMEEETNPQLRPRRF